MRVFLTQRGSLVVAAAVIFTLFAGFEAIAARVGLIFCVASVPVSIVYYNPAIMPERQPVPIDWVENLLLTGLLLVTAALLLYEVLGRSPV